MTLQQSILVFSSSIFISVLTYGLTNIIRTAMISKSIEKSVDAEVKRISHRIQRQVDSKLSEVLSGKNSSTKSIQ